MRITILACWALTAAALSAQSGIASSSDIPDAAVCKMAIVNPVSGYAECVRPLGAPVDPPPPRPAVVKLAVFDFELEDATPAAALRGQVTGNEAAMEKVSVDARQTLAKSGRYLLIDVRDANALPVREKSLRNSSSHRIGAAEQPRVESAVIALDRALGDAGIDGRMRYRVFAAACNCANVAFPMAY